MHRGVWLLILLVPIPVYASNLLISEVFFDGSDERVEILNNGTKQFSGTITVSGASSSPFSHSINIAPEKTIIFGDKGDMFSGVMTQFFDQQGLQITDTKVIHIDLFISGSLGDTFIVEEGDVVNLNNEKASFHRSRLSDGSFGSIEPTPIGATRFVQSPYRATPGVVYQTEEENGTYDTQSLSGSAGSGYILELFTNGVTGYLLFTGTLPAITSITVDTLPVWTGEETSFTSILQTVVPLSGGILSLIDKSGHIVERIDYPAVVSGYAYRWSGWSGDRRLFTQPVTPTIGGGAGEQSTGSAADETEQEEQGEENPPYFTGTYCTTCEHEEDNGEHIDLPDIAITEIFPYDIRPYAEYIELSFGSDFSGTLAVAGLGHGRATKEFFVEATSGSRVVVTDILTGVFTELPVVLLPSISLTDGGESLSVSRQSRQVVDTGVYIGQEKGKAYYPATISSGIQQFTNQGDPTPGISRSYHQLLCKTEEQVIPSCSVLIQNTKPFYSHHKVNLQAVYNGKGLSNRSRYTCRWSFGDQTDYIFTGCNPSYYNYFTGGIYQVELTISQGTGEVCTTTSTINYPTIGGKGDGSKNTYYQGLYEKRKGRFTRLRKQVTRLGYTVSSSGQITTETGGGDVAIEQQPNQGVVMIEEVLPNPVGKDQGNEGIRLTNTSSGSVLLSGLSIFNGKSEKDLPVISLAKNETKSYQGTFSLTNKKTCIQLRDKEFLYDLFCYQTPQEGTRYTGEHLDVSYTQEAAWMQRVSLKEREGKICLVYKYDDILCLPVENIDQVAKQKKQLMKELTKQQKDLTKARTYKEKYTEEKAKRAKDRKKYTKKLDDLRADRSYYQQVTRLVEGYTYLLHDILKQERGVVYSTPKIADLRNLLWRLKDLLQGGRDYELGALRYRADNLDDIYQLEQSSLPLDSVEIAPVRKALVERVKPYVDTLRQTSTIFTSLPD